MRCCCCCCCSGPDGRHRCADGALEVEFNAAVELLVAAERLDTDLGTASPPGGTGVAGPALMTPRRPPPFLRCIPLCVHPMLETTLTNAHPIGDETLRRPLCALRRAAAVVASERNPHTITTT